MRDTQKLTSIFAIVIFLISIMLFLFVTVSNNMSTESTNF